ncbi:uncharacterized protein LOC130624321 isoform X2 [Hydractinia symbiolongicarpus]|uniref:uncharacterized protein LOC130624321 isoform X2 n=1 Tax=Hydractinia symbiolongicarpus TaxID=13093 RepID=UPI00254FB262|nr:uncharacterized protein LOC130624321 isoform X2 [Hydractinia symbiolongicarpus]
MCVNIILSVAFQTWKDDTETSNHCSFVILSGKVKNKQNEAQQYYQCNRCGQHKPNRKGKRRVKMSGTCKIERNCTSTIKATFHADGKVTADICCTHYGHEKELEHTWIPKSSRNSIGSKLQQGVRRDKS